MKRRRSTILMIAAAICTFCLVVGLSLGAWLFAMVFESDTLPEAAASASFDDLRRRFGSSTPVFEVIGDEELVLRRQPPDAPATGTLQSLQIRHWDPDDEGLASVTLPFWLLRMKKGAFEMTSHYHARHLDVSVQDLERYGPALLVDHRGRGGDRLLIWTE
jgi:hypothetical protein